jgi:FKBP-type peptidyl-prolyl cis-trans isomerase (trigger factor)
LRIYQISRTSFRPCWPKTRKILKEKRRIAIADAIGEKTKVELPDIMIESELNRNEAQFKADIERMGSN